MRKIMVTGGYGFIGSNLLRHWHDKYPDDMLINLDAVTYAARPEHVETYDFHGKYEMALVDIQDRAAVSHALRAYEPDHIIHLAAESHVCRSISGPSDFVHTNIVGTFNLLEEFRRVARADARFHHVSTDEVYGQLTSNDMPFTEHTPYAPTSPYSASKAASDMLVRSYVHTYGLNAVITNCSNNFGPNQHEEKLVPKTIKSIVEGKPMQVYGSGKQIRDWLFVEDHCLAIDTVFHRGNTGETYLIGGNKELSNIDMMEAVLAAHNSLYGNEKTLQLEYVNARPTDDFRYAINGEKLALLGFQPASWAFSSNLIKTVEWYVANNFGN